MLTITNQSDYGILLIEQLKDKKNYVPLSELTRVTKLPKRFLARIAANLAKHKIIESKEGKVGGYKLLANLKKISLYGYLKIFEKDVEMAKCVSKDFKCPYDDICLHKELLSHKLNRIVINELKRTKLSDLF